MTTTETLTIEQRVATLRDTIGYTLNAINDHLAKFKADFDTNPVSTLEWQDTIVDKAVEHEFLTLLTRFIDMVEAGDLTWADVGEAMEAQGTSFIRDSFGNSSSTATNMIRKAKAEFWFRNWMDRRGFSSSGYRNEIETIAAEIDKLD